MLTPPTAVMACGVDRKKWTQEFDADTESLSYWPIQLSPLAGRTIEVNEAGEADAVNV